MMFAPHTTGSFNGKLPIQLLILTFSLLIVITLADGQPSVPAMFVFGDATADVGNNNFLPGSVQSKANFPYYGIDYPCGESTGRFSNGFIGMDFIAKKLGFAKSPPPALSVSNFALETKGLSFASGTGGILDTTSPGVTLPMNTQVTMFEDYASRLIASKGKRVALGLLSRSIFAFSTGNSDMLVYFVTTGGINEAKNEEFVSMLVNQYKRQLQRIYDLGARKFVVFGMGDIGCTPAMRLFDPSGTLQCADKLNNLARLFNQKVKRALFELQSGSLFGFKYSFGNTPAILANIVQNSARYGLTELQKACCGTGVLLAQSPCTVNGTVCPNRDSYFSWDRYHPTQAVYKISIDLAYYGGPVFATPINILTLSLL